MIAFKFLVYFFPIAVVLKSDTIIIQITSKATLNILKIQIVFNEVK